MKTRAAVAFAAKQPLEIAHEAKTVIHSHRGERVLRKNVKASEQLVDLDALRIFGDNAVHCLRTAATEQDNIYVARSSFGVASQFVKHRLADS